MAYLFCLTVPHFFGCNFLSLEWKRLCLSMYVSLVNYSSESLFMCRGGFLKDSFASLPSQNRLWSPQIRRQILIWKIFLVRKSTHIYQMSIITKKQSFFKNIFKANKVPKPVTITAWRGIVF